MHPQGRGSIAKRHWQQVWRIVASGKAERSLRKAFLPCLLATALSGFGASSAAGQGAPASPAGPANTGASPPQSASPSPADDNLSSILTAGTDDLNADAASPFEQKKAAPLATVHPSRSVTQAVAVRGSGACLNVAELHRSVARWLERDTVDSRIRVEVVFGSGDQDVRFRVHRRHGDPSDRELEGLPEDCEALLSAAGLSIALAIDAAILEELRVPDDAELVEVKRRPGLLDRLRPEETQHQFSLALSAGGGLSTGLLTSTAPVAMLSLHGLMTPWLELRLGGLFATVSGQRLPELADVSFRATLWAARADVCTHIVVTEWLAALGCAGLHAGAFITTPSGQALLGGETARRPFWAIGLGLGARASLTHFLEFAVHVDLLLPLADRVIQVEDARGEPLDSRALLPAGMVVSAGPLLRFF